MPRIIGLDVGDKRVGTALSDAEGRLATPHQTFERAGGRAERAIVALANEHHVRTLVVGMPYGADGSKNPQCDRVEQFCRRLQRRMRCDIIYVDEYLSSVEAEERLNQSGGKRRSRLSGEIDAASATLLLQEYLDSDAATN